MNTQLYTEFDKWMLVVNKIIIAFLVLITVVPMVYILVASFMDPQALISKGISFDPKDWTIEGYQRVFSDKSIIRGFLNSLFYSFSFAFITVAISVLTAYPLSKKDLVGKKWINAFLVFTMFFGGGLVPTYLLVKDLGMLNTVWAIIIPGAVNVWNIILARTYFQALPDELVEAAVMDGANEFQIFLKIILPLSMPVMPTIALFNAVYQRNDFFTGIIFINNTDLQPI